MMSEKEVEAELVLMQAMRENYRFRFEVVRNLIDTALELYRERSKKDEQEQPSEG